ncbi:MAG: hypothetical protein JRH01_18400 [Deltaproteobacteria bacterium]|nr:hypothetical protein [Deltaproteobacteria bacterium]MBW2395949.1 hypothetical protein [Deltaproteobacteria bacterium]
MASIRKQRGVHEIRECRATPRGPRQYTLARFKDVLTPEVLDEAAARAHQPFDRDRLVERARARGIAVSRHRTHATARKLLAELRRGMLPEPSLVAQLRGALAAAEEHALPVHLAEAADWLGRSEAARGKALRGLLRVASRVAHSREKRREASPEPFPRFGSGESA